jgi:hypothetical protein
MHFPGAPHFAWFGSHASVDGRTFALQVVGYDACPAAPLHRRIPLMTLMLAGTIASIPIELCLFISASGRD